MEDESKTEIIAFPLSLISRRIEKSHWMISILVWIRMRMKPRRWCHQRTMKERLHHSITFLTSGTVFISNCVFIDWFVIFPFNSLQSNYGTVTQPEVTPSDENAPNSNENGDTNEDENTEGKLFLFGWHLFLRGLTRILLDASPTGSSRSLFQRLRRSFFSSR